MTTTSDRLDIAKGPVDAVRELVTDSPHATALTFMDYSTDRSGEAKRLSYVELDTRARAMAGRLQQITRPGDRVAVLCPNGPDYVVGFLACLYAGAIAVPLYAPEAHRSNDRALLVMRDCSCEAVLTVRQCRHLVTDLLSGSPLSHRVLCVDDEEDADWTPPDVDPLATAYLQYTSGSTRKPTGVRVTHRNMAVAAAQMAHGIAIGEQARLVSWLPLFHDMGLVLGMVAPLTIGAQVTLLTPFAFVQQPIRWLRLLTEQRATHTMSPNFGLDLCVDRVSERHRAGLDLSALTVLGNGAEPVRPSTLDRFTDAFAPHGFRHAAHTAGYGLAEATLVVTAQPTEADPVVRHFDRNALAAGRVREDPAGHPMVDCGPPVLQEVRIVDPETGSPCPSRTVGEIWVRGENTCAGYWNDPEQTAKTFDATLCGESGWLRTGDLGFRHEGGLFIAGRVKDLIIVDGRNLYPVDIELAVEESCPAVRRGHVAAFSVDTPRGERIVVVAEPGTREAVDLEVLRRDVRTAVGTRFDVDVHDVVLIRRGTLPKTSSGKLRRRHCGELYQRGRLTVPHRQVSA